MKMVFLCASSTHSHVRAFPCLQAPMHPSKANMLHFSRSDRHVYVQSHSHLTLTAVVSRAVFLLTSPDQLILLLQIKQALADVAVELGVNIRTSCKVVRVTTTAAQGKGRQRVTGVVLESGEELAADVCVSNRCVVHVCFMCVCMCVCVCVRACV